MKANVFFKAAIGALILTLAGWLYDFLLSLPNPPGNIPWNLLANYMVALVLGYYILHSSLRGKRLALIVFIIYFLIGHFNILVEALIFNVTDRGQTLHEIIRGFVVSAIFSTVYVSIMGNRKDEDKPVFEPRTYLGWCWRVVLANVLYLLFYLIAGITLTTVYPEILQFYEGKIPSFVVVIETQLFLRGFIFVAIAVLVLRTSNSPIVVKAVIVGFLFAILGGIAPLISPNELMPGYVRLGHGIEVGVSNFLYGIVVSYMMRKRQVKTPSI